MVRADLTKHRKYVMLEVSTEPRGLIYSDGTIS